MKAHSSSTINIHSPRDTSFGRPAAFALHNATTNIDLDIQMSDAIVDQNLLTRESCASPMLPIVHEFAHFDPYSQGPEGDPFSQPPPPIPLPEPEYSALPPPRKRSRRGRKQEGVEAKLSCSFCQGDENKNKFGKPEELMSCSECGQSGHATCLDIDPNLGHLRLSYPWRCIECKICEVCHEKGDDNRILFCDHCDRGWHMDCVGMESEAPPEGEWLCPRCLPEPVMHPPNPSHLEQTPLEPETNPEPPPDPEPNAIPLDPLLLEEPQLIRQPSVASSSRSHRTSPRKLSLQTSAITEDVEEEAAPNAEPTELNTVPLTYKRSRRRPKPITATLQSTPTQQRRPKPSNPSPQPPVTSGIRIRLPGRNKGKMREEEKSIFEDILGPEDRDTSKTAIVDDDKGRFERSRKIAEEKQAALLLQHSNSAQQPSPVDGPGVRTRRTLAPTLPPTPLESPAPPSPGPSSAEHRVPRISTIRFGEFDIKTWYDAPFPEEYATIPDGRLWICEFCLKYMKSRFGAVRHKTKCKSRHPPGEEIYRDEAVSIFEVDGRKNKIYCQNLCLLSKMFLDHKSLFYDVEPFLFYIMTESDESGCRFVGYFSKEKWSAKDYNLSCIMTLPVRQRQGWGNLLIDFSYLLSKKEQRLGSPEKPLSSLGALGYRNYWILALMRYLEGAPNNPRLEDICTATSLTIEDAFNTLQHLNMIVLRDITPPPVKPTPGQSIKFPRGRKNGIARRALHREKTQEKEAPKGPFVPPKRYSIRWDRSAVMQHLANWEAKGYLKLKPEKLKWSPFISSRNKTAAEGAMDISQLWTTEKLSQLKREDWPSDISIVDEDDPPSPVTMSPARGHTPATVDKEITNKPEASTPPNTRRLLRRAPTRSVTTTPRTAPKAPALRTRRVKSDSTRVIKEDQDLLPSYADQEQQVSEESDVPHARSRSRSEGIGPVKRANSGRSVLARKRRRVESSPEIDDPPMADPSYPRSSVGPQEKSDTVSQTGPTTPIDDPRQTFASVAVDSQDEIKSEEVLHPSDGLGQKGDHRLPFSAPAVETKVLGTGDYGKNSEPALGLNDRDLLGEEDEDAEGEPDDEYLSSGAF